MDNYENELAAAVDDVADAFRLGAEIARVQRDQIGIRRDIASVRDDLAEAFGTIHTRFMVVQQEMTRIAILLERLDRGSAAA